MYQLQWRVMQELCWAGWGKFSSPLAFRQSHMGNKKNNNNNNISEEKQTKTWGPLSLLYDLHHSQWDYLHCVNFWVFYLMLMLLSEVVLDRLLQSWALVSAAPLLETTLPYCCIHWSMFPCYRSLNF